MTTCAANGEKHPGRIDLATPQQAPWHTQEQMAQDKERKEVEVKERALEEKQVKEGKIRKIACIEQWLAKEDAADTTPRPATSESRGTQKGLSQLYCTESYLQVPRFVLELDIGDQKMDIDKNADSHHPQADGDETGTMTKTNVEKPPKKKKKAQDRYKMW
jgi:hypothetical protein